MTWLSVECDGAVLEKLRWDGSMLRDIKAEELLEAEAEGEGAAAGADCIDIRPKERMRLRRDAMVLTVCDEGNSSGGRVGESARDGYQLSVARPRFLLWTIELVRTRPAAQPLAPTWHAG